MTACCPLCGGALNDGGLVLMPERGLVIRGGAVAVLTSNEMQVLMLLRRSAPRIVRTDSIMMDLYQLSDTQPEPKIVDVYICKIRKKIKGMGLDIMTSRGTGFFLKFESTCRVITEQPPTEEAA